MGTMPEVTLGEGGWVLKKMFQCISFKQGMISSLQILNTHRYIYFRMVSTWKTKKGKTWESWIQEVTTKMREMEIKNREGQRRKMKLKLYAQKDMTTSRICIYYINAFLI